jgi:hypothetical protein
VARARGAEREHIDGRLAELQRRLIGSGLVELEPFQAFELGARREERERSHQDQRAPVPAAEEAIHQDEQGIHRRTVADLCVLGNLQTVEAAAGP